MRTAAIFITLIGFLGLAGCNSPQDKKAQSDIARADALAASQDLSSAIQLLDSVMEWNKDNFRIVGPALKKRTTLALKYHRSIIDNSQVLLNGLEPQVAALAREFIFKPGEAGQSGSYEHKRQTVENSWNRTYLKIGLNEKGDIWLTSHYYGKTWIDHTSLRVYDQGNFILTDTIGLGHEWNRKVEDLGDRWEKVEFRDGSDAGAIAFIADNYTKPVKARLTGKTFHYIVLESYDKEAIRKGWELAQLLKERTGLLDTIRVHQAELKKLGA